MEIRSQETDVDILVRNIEAAGVFIPLAPYAQANRLHRLVEVSASQGIPVRPEFPVENEPGTQPS